MAGPGVVVLPLTGADYPEVARIHAAGLATGNAAYAREPAPWQEFAAKKRLEFSFVAADEAAAALPAGDRPLLGWVALQQWGKVPQLSGALEDSIYVDKAARGRGVSDALLARAIAAARESGEVWSIVASVFRENEASQRLHERHGFRLIGEFHKHGRMEYGPWAGQVRASTLWELEL